MTPEQQRIAIASACGIIAEPYQVSFWDSLSLLEETRWRVKGTDKTPLPDYLNDLNAMHAAELTLSFANDSRFGRVLQDLILTPCRESGDYSNCRLMSATAAQRAEAFLRTLGLWKEGAP